LAVARSARRSVVLRDGSILIDTTDHEKASEAIQQSQALL
jgi:hypothetical protein